MTLRPLLIKTKTPANFSIENVASSDRYMYVITSTYKVHIKRKTREIQIEHLIVNKIRIIFTQMFSISYFRMEVTLELSILTIFRGHLTYYIFYTCFT